MLHRGTNLQFFRLPNENWEVQRLIVAVAVAFLDYFILLIHFILIDLESEISTKHLLLVFGCDLENG